MASATFGNFPVDNTDPEFPDSILGAFPGDSIDLSLVEVVTEDGETKAVVTFANGAAIIMHGEIVTQGGEVVPEDSTVTRIEYLAPGNVSVLDLRDIDDLSLLTVDDVLFFGPIAIASFIVGDVTELTTRDFEDVLVGTPLDDTIEAGGGDDILVGSGGNDELDGQAGADEMLGGTGRDTYFVDNPGDVVSESAGQGLDTVFSSITYTLPVNVEELILEGSGAINGTGNASNNFMDGNGANNVLVGGLGHDALFGGSGDDTLRGGSGDDLLIGVAGSDLLEGGAGNDIYVVHDINDSITEAPSGGTDEVWALVTLASPLAANVENLSLLDEDGINDVLVSTAQATSSPTSSTATTVITTCSG